MPINDKAANGQVTFALAIVKGDLISDRAQFSKIEAALQTMFPGVSVMLIPEDDALANYRRCRELSDFVNRGSFRVVSSSKISLN